MISFIIHLRKDSEERLKNISITLPYYRSIAPDCEFVIVEDDEMQNFKYLSKESDVIYHHFKNSGIYNKCAGYNRGLSLCTKDNVCFLDIDCIISSENLHKSLHTVKNENGICIGYNGTCIYFDYPVKRKIETHENLYDFLDTFIDKNKLYIMYKCSNYTITNTRAVGGCLIGAKKVFEKINGFNPNFIGWGYEDNEIISRSRILKVPIFYINTNKPYLFHLPHEIDQWKNKSNHPFYEHNHKEIAKIESMNFSQLTQYIRTW